VCADFQNPGALEFVELVDLPALLRVGRIHRFELNQLSVVERVVEDRFLACFLLKKPKEFVLLAVLLIRVWIHIVRIIL